jgi:hypothetical protein
MPDNRGEDGLAGGAGSTLFRLVRAAIASQ